MDSADSELPEGSEPTEELSEKDRLRKPWSSTEPLQAVDNYQIQAELGRGGMGEVYLATERPLNRQVALKVLPAASRISSTQVKRFLLEAQAVAQLSHDHIVPIYHIGEQKGIYYFAMRYIQGQDLAAVIRNGLRALEEKGNTSIVTQVPGQSKRPAKPSKPSKPNDSTVKDQAESTDSRIDLSALSLADSKRGSSGRGAHRLAISVALIGRAVADALHHAHQHGIVHRDIKPSNLMLDTSNKIWVTDFGLAQLQGAPELTESGDVVGTLRYMSPEQASARRAFIDHRTDIYSLGVTLYELATLQKACRGESAHEILRALTFERPIPIRKINPKLPRDLETIICKATERNPSDRYQSAAEMANDLQRFANNESLLAKRPGQLKVVRNWIWDRPAISAMALAMLVVFALATFVAAVALRGRALAESGRANQAEYALREREGQQLQMAAYVLSDTNPGLGIAAGMAGAAAAPGPFADLALISAVDRNHELRTLSVSYDYPGDCAVSDNGEKVVLCKSRMAVGATRQDTQVWSIKTGLQLCSLKESQTVIAAMFVDNDRYLVTQSMLSNSRGGSVPETMQVQLWDANTFALLSRYSISSHGRISKANFFEARRQLILPNVDRSCTIIDLPSLGEAMVLPPVHESEIVECCFSPDGTKIASLSEDNVVILWDAKNGSETKRWKLAGAERGVHRLFFSFDSTQVCVTGKDGSKFLEIVSDKESRRSETALAVSHQSRLALLQGNSRRSVVVYNTQAHAVVSQCDAGELVFGAILLNGDQLVALMLDEAIGIFDVRTGKKMAHLTGHQDRLSSVVAVLNRPELLSLSWDGTLRHWNVKSDLARRTVAPELEVSSQVVLSLSLDKSKVLVGTVRSMPLELFTLGKNEEAPIQFQGNRPVSLIDGQILTCLQNGVAIWDVKTRRRTNFLPLPVEDSRFLHQVLEIPNHRRVAIVTQSGDLYLWDIQTDNWLRVPLKETERVKAIAVDKTSQHLFVSLSSSELIKIELTGLQRHSLADLPCPARRIELHEDGKSLLITGNNHTAFIFNLETNGVGPTFQANTTLVSARFVGTDRVITHGGLATKHVTLWDAVTGQEVEAVPCDSVSELAINRDRKSVAIAARSGALFWDLTSNEKVPIESSPCEYIAFVSDKLVLAIGRQVNRQPATDVPSISPQLIMWDPRSRMVVGKRASSKQVQEIVAVGDTENYLVSSSTYGAECLDASNLRHIQYLSGHYQPLIGAAIGADSASAISVSQDGEIWQHSLATGTGAVIGSHKRNVTSATFSSDRRLLLTADESGAIQYWDLVKNVNTRTLDTKGKSVTRLCIAGDNTFAAAVLAGSNVKYWDLRTGTETDFSFDENVRQISLSPDSRFFAVVTGNPRVFPGVPMLEASDASSVGPHAITLVSTATLERKQLELGAAVVGCQFIDGGKRLAVLTTEGRVNVFNTLDWKPDFTVSPSRRAMQLLQVNASSSLLVTASKNQIHVWSGRDGSLFREIALDMSWYNAALSLPESLMCNATDEFYILIDNKRLYLHPIDVLSYAKKIAPRPLHDQERQRLLISPLRH